MKLVLDTNVLVAALNFDGLCRLLVKRVARQDELFTSETLLRELDKILTKKFDWSQEKSNEALTLYRNRCTLTEPEPLPSPICRDPDDDHVIAVALNVFAQAVVTGDKDLLILESHQKLRFIAPRDFWDFYGSMPL